MAAYAALLSLMSVIEQIQRHPRPPISFDKQQIESLCEKVAFLQDFLEGHSCGGSEEVEGLDSRIANAAYAAEDIIEFHVVDQILGNSTSHGQGTSSTDHLWHSLQKVIEGMDIIRKEAVEIQKKSETPNHNPIPPHVLRPSSSSTPQKNAMVGFDDILNEIIDKLTRPQPSGQIIPIVGMGGIGKTTLARNVYESQYIVEYFDIRAWATFSQEYNVRELLLQLLLSPKIKDGLDGLTEEELGEKLYKSLFGRRYLIVMDDVWSIEAWNEIKRFLPNSNSESRMIITTRLLDVASRLPNSVVVEMSFLDDDQSWNLLYKNVFGEESDCPFELEEIGRKIAKGCKGLPLSLVVIGGLLSKSEQTRENWEYIAKNLSTNIKEDELCSKVLYTSYNHLPIHLKPCFLYMGVFSEDEVIRVSWLIKLWVSEGFLKPITSKSLEDAGEEYFKELMERNLILAHERGSTGNIKFCKIHDLLRELCLREAIKDKFLSVTNQNARDIPQSIEAPRRIAIHKSTSSSRKINVPLQANLKSLLICGFEGDLSSLNFRLLRVLKSVDKIHEGINFTRAPWSIESLFQLVNLRFLAPVIIASEFLQFPSSLIRLWNLHTIICEGIKATAPPEIWMMPQLRHAKFLFLLLPDPPSGYKMDDDDVLGNLQTLSYVADFQWDEQVVKRIPNIKKLKILYRPNFSTEDAAVLSLNGLAHLHKLESLSCNFGNEREWKRSVQNLIFPRSLKKLDFEGTQLNWEDVTAKIGSLPSLEKLKLTAIKGVEWTTEEEQFKQLKFLEIVFCKIKNWITESSHFPRLEQLVLDGLPNLEDIPYDIGDIPTLQSIELKWCTKAAVISAQTIIEEQKELGNSGLQVRVQEKLSAPFITARQ